MDVERHIVELREDGWTMQHPLSCRPNLFTCAYNEAIRELLVPEQMQPGIYYCDMSESGRVALFEPVR